MKNKEKIDNYYSEIKKTINALSSDLNHYATSVKKVVDMKRPINDQMDITELKEEK